MIIIVNKTHVVFSALYLSHSYSDKLEDITPQVEETVNGQPKTEVELLIDRIQAIQQELPRREAPFADEEQAFSEAAEEYLAADTYYRNRGRHWRLKR